MPEDNFQLGFEFVDGGWIFVVGVVRLVIESG